MIVEQNVKKITSALRFARSETNVGLPEKSRTPTPWRFSILKNRRESSSQCALFHVPLKQEEEQIILVLSPSNSLWKQKGRKREKECDDKKNGIYFFIIRFSADDWGNDRAKRECVASDRSVLESDGKIRQVDNTSVSVICQ